MMALCSYILIGHVQCLNQTTGVYDTIFGTRDKVYNLSNDQISTVVYSSCLCICVSYLI